MQAAVILSEAQRSRRISIYEISQLRCAAFEMEEPPQVSNYVSKFQRIFFKFVAYSP